MIAASGMVMPYYRAFFLRDGHVDHAVTFACPDDETARRYASRLVAEQDVELWLLDRRIAAFRAEKLDASGMRDHQEIPRRSFQSARGSNPSST
jgi:hypothetical protein